MLEEGTGGVSSSQAPLEQLRARATGGDLAGALRSVATLKSGPPVDYTVAMQAMAVPAVDAPLAALVNGDSGDDASHRQAVSLWASRQLDIAWDIRGTGYADTVSTDQWRRYYEVLERVEPVLIRLVAEDPDAVYCWYLRIVTERALQVGQSEGRRRYQRLKALSAHHEPAQFQHLQRLCPKYGGTWDDTFDFARKVVANAPAGSCELGIIGAAHMERWIGEDPTATTYFTGSGIVAEVQQADAAMMSAPPTSRWGWERPHTVFAIIYGLAGDDQRAIEHFRILDGAIDEQYWSYARHFHKRLDRLRAKAAKG